MNTAILLIYIFLRYTEIRDYVKEIADRYPEFVKMEVKGKTKENRDIIVLRLGNSPDGNDTRAIFFDAGIAVLNFSFYYTLLSTSA